MSQIAVSGGLILNTVGQIMGLLRVALPAAGSISNPVSLAITAGNTVLQLIDELVKSGEMSIEDQALLQQEVASILSGEEYKGQQWQPRPESPDYVAPLPKG